LVFYFLKIEKKF